MAVPKIIPYDVELRSVNPVRSFDRPKAYTNDLKSVEFQFKILDMTSIELNTATAITLVYMRDGSFFANPSTDVKRVGNVFSYLLKENEGNHAGVAQIQLVVTIDDAEFASQLFDFEIINGLETKVAQEVMIYDWTTLTRDARAYIDQFVADEVFRDAQFDNAQFDRNTAFVASQDARALAFGTEQTNRGTAFTAEQNERTTAFNESESGRTTAETGRVTAEDGRVIAENNRVTKEGQRVTAENNRVTAEGNRVTAETGRVTAENARVTAETNRAAAFTAFDTRLTAEEIATAANKISAVKAKTFTDVDARFEDVEADTTAMGTNLITNGDFSNGTTGWSVASGSAAVANNRVTVTSASTGPGVKIYQPITVTVGSKYFISVIVAKLGGTTSPLRLNLGVNNNYTNIWINGVEALSATRVSLITTPTVSNAVFDVKMDNGGGTIGAAFYIERPILIDLTATFGAGNEPTAEQMDGIMAKFQNSWFDGTKNLFRANATLNKLMAVDARTEFEAKNEVTNGDFSNGTTGWSVYSSSISVTNGEATTLATAAGGYVGSLVSMVSNHKYYIGLYAKGNTSSAYFSVSGLMQKYITTSPASYTWNSKIDTFTSTTGKWQFRFTDIRSEGWDAIYIKNAILIDLTATFGAGKEPTLAEMDRLMARFPNSWFDGVKPIQTIETLYQEKAEKYQEPWITPTLLNGWSGNLQYRKNEFGNVEFRGGVTGGTVGTPVTTMPTGYRPAINYLFMAMNGYNNTYATGYVTTVGNFQLNTKPAADAVTFSNCFYSIA